MEGSAQKSENSCLEMLCRKKKNFEKFKGKHLYQGLFFNKVVGWSGIFQNIFFYRKEKYFWMLETEIQERI